MRFPIIFGLFLAAITLESCGSDSQAAPVSSAPVPVPSGETDQNTDIMVTFTESDEDFANPERGFYQSVSDNLESLSAGDVASAYASGYRLIYVKIDLAPYRNTDLPPEFLQKLQTAIDVARSGGVKLILRSAYNYPQSETEYRDAKDAPINRVLAHITQLKPLFQNNADVIAFVQAGFIGAWGEWHTSSNELTTPENRTMIRDALLTAVPSSRFIQFRYPPYIQQWAPTFPEPDSAQTGAFRTGFHNDCFLASATDVGTYDEDPAIRAGQRAYMAQLDQLAPFGGETCSPADEPGAVSRQNCNAILAEGAEFGLTYLNNDYFRPAFHDRWIAEGCMPEVRRKMGYRFAITQMKHAASVQAGQPLVFDFVVRNSGWAKLYNARPLAIMLRNESTGTTHRVISRDADPRLWAAGQTSDTHAEFLVPVDVPSGRYAILVAFPDIDARLGLDTRFAVRLANANDPAKGQYWDARHAAFVTGTSVVIK